MQLFLFGSYADEEEKESSDIDAFMVGNEDETDRFCAEMEPYAVKNGGKLDLFAYSPDDSLWSCWGEEQCILNASDNIAVMKEITKEQLLQMLNKEE